MQTQGCPVRDVARSRTQQLYSTVPALSPWIQILMEKSDSVRYRLQPVGLCAHGMWAACLNQPIQVNETKRRCHAATPPLQFRGSSDQRAIQVQQRQRDDEEQGEEKEERRHARSRATVTRSPHGRKGREGNHWIRATVDLSS
jgi:hypothetical protein